MKKNYVAFALLVGSVLVASLSIAFQSQLTIFSFLLLFYLLPLVLFSVAVSMLPLKNLSSLLRGLVGGAVFTFVYTVSFYLNIIDFHSLVAASHIEGVSIEVINMDVAAVANTFITVVTMIWLSSFCVNKLIGLEDVI
ncbi:hypothetical protein ACS6Z0_07340 [Streptococcus suis]